MKSTANKKEATDGKLEKKLNGLKLLPGHDHVQFDIFLKSWKVPSSHQLNSKNDGPVLILKTLFSR